MKKQENYIVYYDGKNTGIEVNEKSVKLSELKQAVPNASPIGNIEFINQNTQK